MNASSSSLSIASLLLLAGVGCEPAREVDPFERSDNAESAEPLAAQPADDLSLQVEQTARDVERGKNLDKSVDQLEGLLEQKGLSDERKDELRLLLSRAYEAQGDSESAIEAVEQLLRESASRERSPMREAAEKRLRFLLTGSEEEKGVRLPALVAPPPIATAMANFFKPDAENQIRVDVLVFGHRRGTSHGIFDIAEAKRRELEQSLNSKINVGQSISSTGSWVGLPNALGDAGDDMPRADRSLLVFYYDLGDLKVPARYNEYLPMPSEEIAKILEQGDGLVVAKERKNAKPTIVIAAPREAQLDAVEAAFAELRELPFEPQRIKLESKLMPQEIQAGIRAERKAMQACYETALASAPKLAGDVAIEFTIENDGSVSRPAVGSGATLTDSRFTGCLLETFSKVSYPRFEGQTIKVRYPLSFSP